MNNKMKAGVAGAAAVAVLATGSTFALWSMEDTISGATITNGTLDVAASEEGWYDTSADRADATTDVPGVNGLLGHTIDTNTWKAVPGDTVAGVYTIDGALSGDNLTATLDVAQAASAQQAGWSFTYQLVDADGDTMGDAVNDFTKIRFSSFNNAHNVTALPVMNGVIESAAAPEYRVLIRGTFDANTIGTDQVDDSAILQEMTVSLAQDRTQDGAGGFKPAG